MLKIFVLFFSFFCYGCQRHTHSHHHDAPGSYKQSVNQQMHLPFHIEQKYENTVSSSNDFEINLQTPGPKAVPAGQVKQNAKK